MTRRQLLPSRALALAFVLVVLGRGAAWAQLTEASIKGVAVDASGQAVASCAVTALHESTGLTRSTRTDHAGAFLLAGLSPTDLHG